MKQNNYARAILDNQIIISAVDSKDIVNSAITIHDLSPISADALGRTLTITALMGQMLKNDSDYLTVVVNGGGVLGAITACSDAKGNVKGYVNNPQVANVYDAQGKLDVKSCVGKDGQITVIKNIGLKQPYVGTAPLVSGGIADDFANYFALSEQQPCAVTIGLNLKQGKCVAGGGVLVQVMPNCNEELLDKVETTLYAMDEMSYQFELNSAQGVIQKFFGDYNNLVFTHTGNVQFRCDCNRDRFLSAIVSLGKEQAKEILDEVGYIETTCHFCNKKYKFDRESVEKLFL